MAEPRTFFAGEIATLTATVVDPRDRGNLAVQIGSRIVHLAAADVEAATVGLQAPGPVPATPQEPERLRRRPRMPRGEA